MLLAGRDPPVLRFAEDHVSFRACSVGRSTRRCSVNRLLSRLGHQWYLRTTSQDYFDPIADFVNAQLKLSIETKDEAPGSSPFFNGRIGEGHFSARGAELWASAVGHRLALFLELEGTYVAAQKP